MPVRKVVTRSGRGFRGEYPSRKVGKMIQWESTLEQSAIRYFEYHPCIIRYEQQPAKIEYSLQDGSLHTTVPDFKIELISSRAIFTEIKPAHRLKDKKVAAKLGAIARRLYEIGEEYRVITDQALRRQPLAENLARLDRARKPAPDTDELKALVDRTDLNSGVPYIDASTLLGGEHQLLKAIAFGWLLINLDSAITPGTLVWTNTEENRHHGSFLL